MTQIEANKIISKRLSNRNYYKQKNVIEAIITPEGKMKNFRYLLKSDKYLFDEISAHIMNLSYLKYPKPKTDVPIRYIFIYRKKSITTYIKKNNHITHKKKEPGRIYKGTTYFKHSNKQQRRYFITNQDGYVYIEPEPASCHKKIILLDENNRKIKAIYRYQGSDINLDLPKGLYKIFINTARECKINLEYK